MNLNELRDKAYNYAKKQGFHKKYNFHKFVNLMHCELSEMVEADWQFKWLGNPVLLSGKKLLDCELTSSEYARTVKGCGEEKLADLIIRACDFAGKKGIDIDWHVKAKMAYNETRPYKHGKKY